MEKLNNKTAYIGKVKLKTYIIIITLTWTSVTITSILWNRNNIRAQIRDLALHEARSHFKKDLSIRYWATSHGGVYVPVSKGTPPNPQLKQIPERDIITPSGRKLTLMNPTYMLRQIMEEYSLLYGIKGRVTSLKPLFKGNSPDEWEVKALKLFENGVDEVTEFTRIEDSEYLRMIRPMITGKNCLRCHEKQGYREGDIRGGISISVPLKPYSSILNQKDMFSYFYHSLIFIMGIFGIAIVGGIVRTNILERTVSDDKLRRSLREKETLIKEIHHRVKNNMQVVSSIINLQAYSTDDTEIRELFRECQNRVRAMAIVHEKLYKSENLATINLKTYSDSLLGEISTSINSLKNRIMLNIDIEDIFLSIDEAIPCGLIINELVSNSYRHAFNMKPEGIIEIKAFIEDDKRVTIIIRDNGCGISHDIEKLKSGSLGLQLVYSLAEQLQGTVDLKTEEGTQFRICFSIQKTIHHNRPEPRFVTYTSG